ncbi:SIR2 family protein [Pseudoalteromonas distincta]|uniref:SIR2 family protein n=1 Tax=Pseudoalteromonas TaxID=53246 RepID=UPI00020A0B47|nr:SIR2 family protein [Pseudoalteromonas distincta]EGI71568.1 phage protein [Pseudoalteromonas distincta]
MSEIFEIAYAAATNRLCFFTGTGFSKAVTNNGAPSWQGLLENLCDLLPDTEMLRGSLFPDGKSSPLSLEEIAQVISIKLTAENKSIHEETAKLIEAIKLGKDNEQVAKFFSERQFRVVTTNYDKLAEELTGKSECQSLAPGLPIPRSSANVKVYHVHGSIDSPDNMVITSEDYFKFINGDSYFSRKLSTVLHENTVIILGYSLGDTNLKAIISDYKGFSRTHVIGSNIFLISRSDVDQHVKDYYSHCYGIRVLDNLDIPDFFSELNEKTPKVESIAQRSIDSIRNVVYKGYHFKEAYLKLEDSFYRIVSALSAEGLSLDDERVVAVIGDVIDAKRELTTEKNAWEQYEQLARWLIYLGTILDIKGTSIEDIYLKAVLRSMNTMSNRLITGYSWHAYKVWKHRWSSIMASNRGLIRKHVQEKTTDGDALSVVNSI